MRRLERTIEFSGAELKGSAETIATNWLRSWVERNMAVRNLTNVDKVGWEVRVCPPPVSVKEAAIGLLIEQGIVTRDSCGMLSKPVKICVDWVQRDYPAPTAEVSIWAEQE